MAYESRQIANEFIRLARAKGRGMPIMTLMKLTYLAHAWTLAVTHRPLLTDSVEAWEYGTVIPDLYFEFKEQGVHDLEEIPMEEKPLDPDEKSIISQIYEHYKNKNALQLTRMIDAPGSPWDTEWPQYIGRIIPNAKIEKHYARKLAKAKSRER